MMRGRRTGRRCSCSFLIFETSLELVTKGLFEFLCKIALMEDVLPEEVA